MIRISEDNLEYILETTIDEMASEVYISNRLKRDLADNGINTILDLLKKKVIDAPFNPPLIKKEIHELNALLLNYGIRFIDEEECRNFISQYNELKNPNNYFENDSSMNDYIIFVQMMQTPIEKLELSNRSFNALKKYNLNQIIDIVQIGISGLYRVHNLGTKSYNEIINSLLIFNINIEDEEACKTLIEQYESSKEFLNVKKNNYILSKKISNVDIMSKDLLIEIKKALEDNKALKEKLRQKENDYEELVNLRNLILELTTGLDEPVNGQSIK
jgi:hypothetical protein